MKKTIEKPSPGMLKRLRELGDKYSKVNGAAQVWMSWVTIMNLQQRKVEDEYASWKLLPERDKKMDSQIARDVIDDFLTWLYIFHRNIHDKIEEAIKDVDSQSN